MPKYGLIGKSLEHSFSPTYFAQKFKQLNREDCSYSAFPLDQIESLKALVYQQGLAGFNVTIPYKSAIIPLLYRIDDSALKVGAVNTVKVIWKDKTFQMEGYNTDIIGFRDSLLPFLKAQHQNALILGSGGASKAIKVVLDELSVESMIVSRDQRHDLTYADLDKDTLAAHTLLINCTPLGTAPHVNEMPAIPWQALTKAHLVYDLVYNPQESMLLQKAKSKEAQTKNGLEMLHLQADAAWEIWTSTHI